MYFQPNSDWILLLPKCEDLPICGDWLPIVGDWLPISDDWQAIANLRGLANARMHSGRGCQNEEIARMRRFCCPYEFQGDYFALELRLALPIFGDWHVKFCQSTLIGSPST